MSRTIREASHYEILGVPRDAPAEQIRQRYREMALKLHPDRERSALAGEAMALVNNAYDVLSDPKRRAAYDAALKMPDESCSKTGHQARPCLRTALSRRIRALIAIVIITYCMTGSQFETSHIDDRSISDQYVKANRHYFSAMAHEPLAALPLFIPALGLAWGTLGSFTTGLVCKAVITVAPGPALPYIILASIAKLAAYYIGMCSSMKIAVSIKRRRLARLDRIFIMGDLAFVELFSLLAGYLEHASANVS